MSSNRVGGPPPPSEPSRGGGTPDSKKFREELQKVQKVKEVDPDEQSRQRNRRFAARMGDEDVPEDLNAGPRNLSPFEVGFVVEKPTSFRSTPSPARKAIDDSANTAVPSPAYSQPPTTEPVVQPTPRSTEDASARSLPSSEDFWEDVNLPDEPPPPRQNFRETAASQQREPERDRQPTAKGAKKKKVETKKREEEPSPFAIPQKKGEEISIDKVSGKPKKVAAEENEEEEIPPYYAQPLEEHGKKEAPRPKKEIPIEDESYLGAMPEDEEVPEKPKKEVFGEAPQHKTAPKKEEFSPFGVRKEIPGVPEKKEALPPSPWSVQKPKEEEARPHPKKKEEPYYQPPIPGAPLPEKEAVKKPEEGRQPTKERTPEEGIPIQAPGPMSPAPWLGRDEKKPNTGREEKEIPMGAPLAPPARTDDREGGRGGGNRRDFEKIAAEIIQPALPALPADIQPMAQSATVQAAPYLTPETMSLFYQMVGTIYVMTAPTGISRTEVVLNSPSFAYSKFYGATITIEKYATAPDSLNIRLTGSNEAVMAFNQNISSLVAAFQNGNFRFRIGRIDASYATDKPVMKRKEKGEGKDSGGFEGKKR
ncbi:MAG: hypothetical protein JSS32_09035 [Verrucomicrobia bacterium]|nr:hypothetical protein [Verrucomicrobiota bacterium]